MKQIIRTVQFLSLLAVLLVGKEGYAQTSGAIITTQPASFTGDDQVKIIIDVSNVPNLAGVEPLYLWTWNPNEPAPGNGQWNNSNEGRKLTKEGPNRWSITMVPKDFYGVDAASITKLEFLVKAKDGSGDKKTDNISINVAPLTFVPTDFRTFPRIVSVSDVITVYLDQSLATDLKTQRMTPTQAKVALLTAAGAVVGTEKTIALTREGDKLFSFMLMPTVFFGVPANSTAAKMRIIYTGTLPDANGVPVAAESVTYEKVFDNLQ